MGWFSSSKDKQDRNNAAYADGFQSRQKASPMERLSNNLVHSITKSSSSEEHAWREGYKEAERRTCMSDRSKKP
jgi:hypothetical protein